MITKIYRITENSDKALERVHDFPKIRDRGHGSYWADIHAYSIDQLEAWLINLNLSPQAKQCCLDSGQGTRFIPRRKELFFEFSVYANDLAWDLAHLSFLCMDNLVIALHSVPLESLDDAIKGLTFELMLTD